MPSEALDIFTEPVRREWLAPLLGEPVLGIDPSLTGFAICYSEPGKALKDSRWSSKPADGVRDRCARYEQLMRGVLQLVPALHPALVLIEAYAFSKGEQYGHHDIAEFGGVLRTELCKRTTCPIVEVAPNTLKKFTTGDGKASKPLMISELAKKHGRRFASDDAADAFALCQLGLALTGQIPEPSTKAERTYLAGLRKSFGLKEVAP